MGAPRSSAAKTSATARTRIGIVSSSASQPARIAATVESLVVGAGDRRELHRGLGRGRGCARSEDADAGGPAPIRLAVSGPGLSRIRFEIAACRCRATALRGQGRAALCRRDPAARRRRRRSADSRSQCSPVQRDFASTTPAKPSTMTSSLSSSASMTRSPGSTAKTSGSASAAQKAASSREGASMARTSSGSNHRPLRRFATRYGRAGRRRCSGTPRRFARGTGSSEERDLLAGDAARLAPPIPVLVERKIASASRVREPELARDLGAAIAPRPHQ